MSPTSTPTQAGTRQLPCRTTSILVATLLAVIPTLSQAADVIYAYGSEAVTLDVADIIDGPSFDVAYNIHEGLVDLSRDGEIEPVLATQWSLSEDGLSWTFYLREDVRFHDGTKFDANAVKFNFDRIMEEDEGLANRGQWEPYIETVDVVDDYTVKITTYKPYGSLLNLMADDFGKFMNSPTAVKEGEGDYGRNPVGTGPFKFESWRPGERLVIIRNPDYWREGPGIESVTFRPTPEGSSRVLSLEAGDVHVISQVPAHDSVRLAADDNFRIMETTLPRLFYWAFNNTKEVWSNPDVRIALNMAIDRESIVENVLLQAGAVARSYVSPILPASMPFDLYDYDPEGARSMLERLDFPFDRRFRLYATEGRYYQDRQVAEAMAGMLSEIGVNFDVEIIEWSAFVDAIWFTPPDDPIAQARDAMQTTYGSNDPPTWMRQTLVTSSWPPDGFNEAVYSNEMVDQLVIEVNETTNMDDRNAILQEIQRELINDPPWIISHFEQAVIAHQPELTGLFLSPQGRIGFRLSNLQ